MNIKSSSAVGVIFEEMMFLAVVIVSLTLFMSFFSASFFGLEEREDSRRGQERCDSFLYMVAVSETLCFGGIFGSLDGSAVRNLSGGDIALELPREKLGFHYSISVRDVSGFPDERLISGYFSTSVTTLSGKALFEVYSSSCPVVMLDEVGNAHGGVLYVSIW